MAWPDSGREFVPLLSSDMSDSDSVFSLIAGIRGEYNSWVFLASKMFSERWFKAAASSAFLYKAAALLLLSEADKFIFFFDFLA